MTTTKDDSGLDNVSPQTHPSRDAVHMRAIIAAADQVRDSEAALREAVVEARAAGDSWAAIGFALGISRQAAQQRFGRA